MTAQPDRHLHVLARNRDQLTGPGAEHLTPERVGELFTGTAYRDDPALWKVVTGELGRGYTIVPDGWVAVTWCSGASQDACAEVLVNVAVAGDIRAATTAGLL